MNATKRKFNALLNGIGPKSTPSSHKDGKNAFPSPDLHSSVDLDSLAKKRRVVDTLATQYLSSSPLRPKSASAMKHMKSASVASPALPEESPKYAPWDRIAFLKRLKTFSNLTDWSPKPVRVNEVEWAKRGWVSQKSERVRCCLCNVEILVKLNKKEVDGKEEPVYIAANIGTNHTKGVETATDSQAEEALVDKYAELIITSHNEDCLWRKRGCDDTIFKLPLNYAATTIENFQERYTQLCERKDKLPYIFNLRAPEQFDVNLLSNYIPPTFSTPSPSATDPPSTETNKPAFLMALFGWQGYTHDRLGAQLDSVSCQACFRVLGLWLFKSKKVNEAGEEILGPTMSCLDIVMEHRDYCPWRNAVSQNGPNTSAKTSISTMAGWEIILRVLKNENSLRIAKGGKPAKQASADNISEINSTLDAEIDDEKAQSIIEEEDKKRWVRLRRVKSLFDTKGRKPSRTDTKSKQFT